MAQLTCKDLSVGYENHVVVGKLNFSVGEGEYWVVVGENGAGKSTLMKTLLGLLKPVEGSVTLGDGLKRNEIGYLPQQAAYQKDFPASVWEVVLSGNLPKMGLRPFYKKEEKELAKNNLVKMGLDGYEKRSFRDLSGGQQQRVLLARALCATRKILLLDEPVSGLDPIVTAEMYELVSSLNREGTTVIMITHDVGAVKYATHVLHVGDGTFAGKKEEYEESDMGKRFLSLGGENA